MIIICQQNFHHAQDLQKRPHNKSDKPQSYATGDKVWLSSKHLKTKRNCKLEAKFFDLFWVLHQVGNQAYKLKVLKKWRIHNVFHVSMIDQDSTKKKQVNDTQLDFAFKTSINEEYKVDAIWDNAVYAKEQTTS